MSPATPRRRRRRAAFILPAAPGARRSNNSTRDRKDLLELCVKSLDEATSYPNKEIIILDNGSEEEVTKAYFANLSKRSDVRVIAAPGPFNYPRLINLGASHARGEILMTLNNDIEAFEPDWLG